MKIPTLLQSTIPATHLADNIVLKLLPKQKPHLPVVRGITLYNTTFKTLQLLLTSFYLNPQVRLHITHINIEEPTGSLSSNDMINLSIQNNLLNVDSSQQTSPYTTKITVKWRTCLNGCLHLRDNKTTSAQLGAFNLDNINFLHLNSPVPNLTKLSDNSIERVVSGIFVFELNDANDKIAVHCIDNCEIIENKQPSPNPDNIGFVPGA
ncbi:hypothetical protein OGAPHI_004551 [Ogataea philodendri]|uniref:Uncharacterized protein n=1 Tax=Ogataea philodendri TaxID=1378263 RepID=A0A9P8P2U8_9ASCO|nr:uncharacterized protein OGAPHI_004551 [Ogataea philodendri]KAH3664200.1 hypothetical protein OGAPHI_004551 [Ogataea philodendri]